MNAIKFWFLKRKINKKIKKLAKELEDLNNLLEEYKRLLNLPTQEKEEEPKPVNLGYIG